MGTSYAVELAAPIDDTVRTGLAELIEVELAAINRAMSTYDPQSELSQFNRRQDLHWAPASQGLVEVLHSASLISTASQGAFDVTVGPLVDLWGFGPEYRTRRVPDDAVIERVRKASATSTCKPTHPPVQSERQTVASKSTCAQLPRATVSIAWP